MRHREGEEREKADENSVEEGRPVSVHLLVWGLVTGGRFRYIPANDPRIARHESWQHKHLATWRAARWLV